MATKRTEPERLPADDASRRVIAEELGTTMLVEAAAGTGKTTCLVGRMVALVATGAARVENLSAVTFTIRAAAQLSQRFQNELERRRADEKDAGRRRNLDEALSALESCFVGTIHAFCARLLRERPVEAGVDPAFREMDEPEDNVAREEAWERYVQSLFVANNPVIPRLSALGVRMNDLREAYDEVCENSDVEPAFGPETPEPDFAEARRRVAAFLEQAAPAMPAEAAPDGWTGFENAVRRARRLSVLLDTNRGAEFVQVLQVLRGSKAREKAPRALKTALESLQDEVVKPALKAWAEFLHPIVMPVLVAARDAYRSWRRENGRLNFQDLLIEARDLLRRRPDVRRALRRRFTPILVDEFQDTDPIQAELLFYLTGEDSDVTDWKKLRPAPGSLFVVGDPKQSIYRFRRADIQTYQTVRRLIQESGGRIVTLSTNFRSTGALCDWVNRAFGHPDFFPSAATPQQAAYVALDAHRTDASARPPVYRLEVPGSGSRVDPVVQDDSERISRFIAASVASGAREPGDFLVLFRRRRYMGVYARALERLGVPYEIAGGGAFGESEELAAVVPLLEALADPDDPVPFVAALRGPIFGVDDDALYRFARSGGRFRFTAEPPPGADPRITRAVLMLREALADVETLPPAAAIARLCDRLGLVALASAEELGASRAGNLLKALAAARKFSAEGLDFAGVVGELDRMRHEDLIEQMSLEPGRPGVVRLMTLHGAKGLEAPVVFLAEPAADNRPPRDFWIDRKREPPAGYFRVVQKLGQRKEQDLAAPAGWDAMREAEEAFEQAETIRLLYVGATRAEEMLVVSVKRTAAGKAAGPWALLDRFLSAALPGPAAPSPATEPPELRLDEDAETARAERTLRRIASSRPTYSVASVTSIAHAGPKPSWEATGRGISWGRVLHGVLEALMRDPDVDARVCAANLLVQEERPASDLDDVLRVVEGVLASSLWARARAARRRLVEVPFALTVSREDLGLTDGPDETLLTGAIDLLFEEDAGWTLVDYKSDTVGENREQLVAFYAPQIALYRRYWERLTGRPARAGLFFLHSGEVVWPDDPEPLHR
ncbi:MAG TPA: UvrD-helicase domain-containing protein [Thermoanaerobaculia bacterium]|nr:UvrD-helicase domain-containing protein [Thermoanaerobaculia bacterium]